MDDGSWNLKEVPVDPIPQTGLSEVLGLLEVLDDKKGSVQVYTLARDLSFDFSQLLLVIKAAEMLGFLETPGTEVVLKPPGKKMIELDMNAKKHLMLEQVRSLSLFQYIKDHLEAADEKRLSKGKFLEILSDALPKEQPELLFNTLINWGRYSEFLGYSQDDDYVYLDQG